MGCYSVTQQYKDNLQEFLKGMNIVLDASTYQCILFIFLVWWFIFIWLFSSKLFCEFSKKKHKDIFLSFAFPTEHAPPADDKEIKPPEKSAARVNASAHASKSIIEELSGEETPIVGSMSEAQAAKRLISPAEQVRKEVSHQSIAHLFNENLAYIPASVSTFKVAKSRLVAKAREQ